MPVPGTATKGFPQINNVLLNLTCLVECSLSRRNNLKFCNKEYFVREQKEKEILRDRSKTLENISFNNIIEKKFV